MDELTSYALNNLDEMFLPQLVTAIAHSYLH
jgi:hypothetical protein